MPNIITLLSCAASLCLLSGCATYLPVDSNFIPQPDSWAIQNDRRLPDPRFRPPLGAWEIDQVASMVAKATGQRVSGSVVVTESTALASIGGPLENGEIRINPRAAATIPPNSWAFIIGHEFAHRTHGLSSPNGTNPEMEAEADAIGARYAMAAGFDLAAHLDWTLTHLRDGWSPSHGSTHERAYRLAARYGFSNPPMW